MASGVRTRFSVALNGKGFLLRGSPQNPAYVKRESSPSLSKLDINDPAYNPLNGSDWSYWGQTDWSGGFQQLKFKDDASFRDGREVDVTTKYGEVKLQKEFTQKAEETISGVYTLGATGLRQTDGFFGLQKAGVSKIYRISGNADITNTLSSMAGISGVNSMSPFKSALLIGLSRLSGTLKTLIKYDRHGGNVTLSGFRNANPIVRAVKGIGIRAYTAERVTSLSGDVLYYTTNLSGFTSAYQTGRGDKMTKIEDLNGVPYFFIEKANAVQMYRFDEYQGKAFLIYTFDDLTAYGISNFLTMLVIGGTSNGERVAFAYNGTRLVQIFKDQLIDTTYDFSRPFVYKNNLHFKGAMWDGSVWFPGLYGKFGAVQVTPFQNRLGTVMAIALSGMTNTKIQISRLSSAFRNSGYVVGSDFGHNIGYVDKLVNAVTVNCEPLSAGQTIEIFRSTNGGNSYTTVGRLRRNEDGAISSKTLYYPSGFVTKSWLYKATLASTSGLTSPVLKDVIHEYRQMPDAKSRWSMALQADDGVQLLNGQKEQRSGAELVAELWREKERKQTLTFEDVNAFSAKFISAMTSAATSARVSTTDRFPRRGRLRVVVSGVSEEMYYTSADGKLVKGITRGVKQTKPRAYTTAHAVDNFYTVIVTGMEERLNFTDEGKTESVASVDILEV